MAFSYASYAGNGSNKNFSVPFPYLLKAHVKVYTGFNILDGTYTSLLVEGTDYTWTSGTQVQTTVAPANGVTLTVLRDTPDSSQLVPWTDGSNLVSNDLNTADLQNLYVVQEQQDRNDAGITQSIAAQTAANAATTAANTATSTANTALSTSNTALTNANAAVSTANTASTNASAAVSTANTAASNASAAVSTANAASSTANTASTNASNAVTTANAAAATAATALSTANTAATNASAAVSTANTASSNASAAVTTANTASTNASNAVSTANTASTNASAAVTTANTASTNASNAVTTANAADNKANQAIAAVSNSINYQLKANVAAIPASPANDTYIEVQDSTGLESFTPLAGMPAGFVGDSGLSVRLRYTTAGTTWNWLNYYANNSDSRYLKLTGGTLTGQIKADDSTSAATPGYAFDGDPNTGIGRPGADELALITGGTARLTIDSSGSVAVAGALTKGGNNVVTVGDTGTVTSTMVADGTLINADINASAGIAGTKISPDFGSQTVTTTGIFSAAAGAAATPSIAFTGDTNTGIYSPGADQVAVTTAGAQQLLVDSFGVNTSGGGVFRGSVSSYAVNGGVINFSAPDAQIRACRSGGNYAGMRFFTQGANSSGAQAERMAITTEGLVGIGTASPSDTNNFGNALDVNGTTGSALYVRTNGSTTNFGIIGHYGTDFYINNNSNGPTRFFTNTAERLRLTSTGTLNFVGAGTAGSTQAVSFNGSAPVNSLVIDSSGRLGLGTSSPSNTLHVVDSSSQFVGTVRLGGGSGSSGYYATIQQDALTTGKLAINAVAAAGSVHGIQLQVDGTSALAIDASRRVGIGTTSPSYALDINGSQGVGLQIFENSSGNNRRLRITQESSGVTYDATYSLNGNAHRWLIGGGEAARITANGQFLVGTSSSISNVYVGGVAYQSPLQVIGNAAGYGNGLTQLNYSAAGYPSTLSLGSSKNATVGVNGAVASGDDLAILNFVGNDGTNFRTGAYMIASCDGTVATGDVPTRLTFWTKQAGVAALAERVRITSAGYFKATATGSYYAGTGLNHEFISSASTNTVIFQNTGANPYGPWIFHNTDSNNTSNYFLYCQGGSTLRAQIYANGGIANYQSNNVNLCDEREKKNIINLDSTWDCLKHWELKKFHYNEDADTDNLRYGVIAQQVADYCPEVISEWVKQKAEPAKLDDEGNEIEPAKAEVVRMAVKEQQMMWMAIKALQEAQVRIETLEAEVAALKGA